jgi:hypothetical protein
MHVLHKLVKGRSLPIALLLALIVGPIAHFSTARADLKGNIIYWVFDVGTADSQFGYWNGTVSNPVGSIFDERDFEGLGIARASSRGSPLILPPIPPASPMWVPSRRRAGLRFMRSPR